MTRLAESEVAPIRLAVRVLECDMDFLKTEKNPTADRLRNCEGAVVKRLKALLSRAVDQGGKARGHERPSIPAAMVDYCGDGDEPEPEPAPRGKPLGPPPREVYAESEPEPEPRRPVTGPAPQFLMDAQGIPPSWGNVFD